ncbi:MAG: energy transducer TonB [Chitinivibrionales bacterium]
MCRIGLTATLAIIKMNKNIDKFIFKISLWSFMKLIMSIVFIFCQIMASSQDAATKGGGLFIAAGSCEKPEARQCLDEPSCSTAGSGGFRRASNTTSIDSANNLNSLPLVDQEPVFLSGNQTAYPSQAIGKEIEGTVELELLLNESGKVDSVTVVHSLNPLFDSAALASAKAFTFSPAKVRNNPVPVRFRYL